MKKYIILLIAISILIRIPFLIMVINHPITPYTSHDSFNYDFIAKNILANQSFSIYLNNPQVKDPVRTPGYPLFLSLVYSIFPDRAQFVVFIQLLIDISVVLLLFLFVKTLYTEKAGIIAGFLYTFNIHQSLFSTQLLTEILFTLCLVSAIFFFFLFIRKRVTLLLLLSGILVGISIMIRPIAILFPFIPFIFLMKKKVLPRLIVLFLISIIIFPLTWTIRNTIVFKRIFYTNIQSVNLILYSAPSIIGDIEGISREKAQEIFFETAKSKYALTDYEIENFDDNPILCARLAREARKVVVSYPLLFVKHQVMGIIHTIIPLNIGFTADILEGRGAGRSGLNPVYSKVISYVLKGRVVKALHLFIRERSEKIGFRIWTVIIFILVYQAAIYVLAIIGVKKQKVTLETIFLFLTIAYFLIIPGEVGEARFRVPVEPFIALFAALAFFPKNVKKEVDDDFHIS